MSGRNTAAAGREQAGDQWAFGEYVSRRDAVVVQISSLTMIIFCALMVFAASGLIAGFRRGESPSGPRTSPWATVLALTSAMGILLSSATIYLTYRPYWYIFQRAILEGDRSQARDLGEFLAAIRTLPVVSAGSNSTGNLPMYFWAVVTLLATAGLASVFLRHLPSRPRANRLQNHPPAP